MRTIVNVETGETTVDNDFQMPTLSISDARARMVVSKWQAKEALRLSGLLASATAAVNAADERTQLAWSEVQQFERNSPTIAAVAGVLGLSDAQVDDLFALASVQSA